MLRRLALAGMVALLVGGAACAETPERTQDDSIEALRTRAEAGDADAQDNLGLRYVNGRGVPQDDAEAVRWYRLAADQGFARAQFNLGVRYATGRGVPQDGIEAYKWLNLATTYTDASKQEEYAEVRDDAAERLTRQQRAEGQKLSREWLAAHPQ